jgi:hypothetical protein
LSMCETLEMDEIREVFCMCHELRSEDVLSRSSLNAGQCGGVRVTTVLEYLLYHQKDRLHLNG